MIPVYCAFFSGAALIALLLSSAGVLSSLTTTLLILGTVAVLGTMWHSGRHMLLSPVRLYVISVAVFIMARPLIDLAVPVDLVQVGDGITTENLLATLAVIGASVGTTAAAYFLSGRVVRLRALRAPSTLRLHLPSPVREGALLAMIGFGLFFLYRSWIASRSLGVTDYFSAMDNPEFHAHIRFFFLAKLFGVLWLLSESRKDRFRACAGLLCLFASGFLLIGLRGYFLSYFFVWAYFINERMRFGGKTVILAVAGLLYLASFILEYRLGFAVFNNTIEMVTLPLYQQGASFEVVFGTVAFRDEIRDCLPFWSYTIGNGSFGTCVDLARSVPFDEGGFASSFFAEAHYFGLPVMLILSGALGLGVRLVQHVSVLRTTRLHFDDSFIGGIILFYVLPNLVYFARSSAFDFVFKLTATLGLCAVLFHSQSRRQQAATSLPTS